MSLHARISRRGRSVVVAAALAVGTAAAFAAPAEAAQDTLASCTPRLPVTVTPGFTPTPGGSGTITTFGETGSITCVGELGGDRVTGVGSAGIHYAYTQGSCTGHIGLGTVSVSIPTTGGIKHLEGTLHVKRTALVVQAVADFPGAGFTGLGVVIPTQGTCLLTPLTAATVVVTGVLSGP
jgi:hypothetical protein